jgi:hypothetical protein
MGFKNILITFIFLVFLIFFISFVSSKNISFSYPREVCVNEEFNVQLKIINFSQDIYDVKIDIYESSNRIFEVYDGNSWKSTFYYLNDAISNNEEKFFLLKIVKDFNWALINVTLRDSKDLTTKFTGYNISKKDNCFSPPTNSSMNTTIQNQTSQNNNLTNYTAEIISEPLDYDYYTIHSKSYQQNTTLNTISLNSQDIKTEKNSAISNKIKSYSVYYIISFAVLLLLLFLLKRRKKDKNEFG